MIEPERLAVLAEAVADGRHVDWHAAAQTVTTEDEREHVASFEELAAIGAFFKSLSIAHDRSDRERVVLAPGSHWGPFRVIAHVGRGRFGDVYRAWDPALEREVALKLVDDVDATPDDHVVDEGRLMARVRHPNVAAIHGAQRIDGVTGLWMEFVEGRTLASELSARGLFTAELLTSTGIQLCRALAAVHAAGLVHRDVKASNVLVDRDGRLVLGDFGTGGDLKRNTETCAGLVGTPAYLAPEIFRGEPATRQSDIYSLGVLLFHLGTGTYPFVRRSLRELMDAHTGDTPQDLAEARPDLPASLTQIISRAIDPDFAQRYQSADEIARALEAHAVSGARRRRTWWLSAGVTASLVLAILVWFVWPTSAPAFSFKDRDWVLVAAFENRTTNPHLDGALEYALELELANSARLNVVPRVRIKDILALMRRPLDARVDEHVGREVAIRDGQIRAVLTGQIDAMGSTYRLTARINNPNDGRIVLGVEEHAVNESDVLPAVARLSVKVGTRLGASLPPLGDATNPKLPRVTTRSIEALMLYTRTLPDLSPVARPAVAERLLQEATRLDPDFGMAHVALARAIWLQRLQAPAPREFRSAEIDAHLTAARDAGQLLTAEERYRVAAEAASLEMLRAPDLPTDDLHRQAAVTALEALRLLRPDDVTVLLPLLQLGDKRAARVKPLVERLLALRPNSPFVLVMAAAQSAAAGEDDLARSLLAQARPVLDLPTTEGASDEAAVTGRVLMFEDAWSGNDMPAAAALAKELAAIWQRSTPQAAAIHGQTIARVFLTLGQFARAEAIANGLERNDGVRELILSSITISRGDAGSARAFLNRYRRRVTTPWVSWLPVYLAAGRLDSARAAVAAMKNDTRLPAGAKDGYRARLALAEGQPQHAIELLEPLLAARPDIVWSNLLADARVAVGDIDRAIQVLERAAVEPRVMRRRGIGISHHWLAQEDRLARLYRQKGRSADADRVDARLRTLLMFADADHPIKRRLDSTAR